MMYKKCHYCDANLDHGETCDCRREAAKVNTDFAEVLKWAKTLEKKYPELAELREETMGGYKILRLPVMIGVKLGFIAAFDESIVNELRRQNYAVIYAKNQEEAQYWLLDTVKILKEHKNKKKAEGSA
jgi:hypothetical protein